MICFSSDQRNHFLTPLREFLFNNQSAFDDCADFVGIKKSTLRRMLLGYFPFDLDAYIAISFIVDHYKPKE